MKQAQRLDSVADITMGQAPEGESYNFDSEGLPLIAGAGDFGELHPEPKKFTTAPGKTCQTGDVILGIRATIGEKVLADGTYCLGRGVAGLRAKSVLDERYLWHWLTHIAPSLAAKAKGATFKQVNREDIGELPITLPPLPEQRRIAEILDKADALRAKRRATLAQLDTLTQSIFLDMFGDPATNPKGWNLNRLDETCEVGSSKRVFVEELVDTGIPFYRGTEIGQLAEGLNVEPSLFMTEEHFERLKAQTGVPKIGDLLLPSICPDGRIYTVDDSKPFYFKDARVLWIKVDGTRINSAFLRHHLKQLFAASYSKIASGTTFAELKIVVLKALGVPVVPLALQRRFAAIAESINSQVILYRTQHVRLEHLFTSLQLRAFSGDL